MLQQAGQEKDAQEEEYTLQLRNSEVTQDDCTVGSQVFNNKTDQRIDCASASCPVIRAELPTGDALERLMTQAAEEFVNDPQNVAIDHVDKTVALSSIFKWFRKDFVNDLRANGRPSERGLIDYVATLAQGTLQEDLEHADGYAIEFRDYDWDINSAK